ncbi:phage head closure protein, partial [Enterobacter hormaechei]
GNPVPAEVNGISGREQLSGGAETAQATIRVWMRFRSELNASSRLEVLSGPYKGQVLNIIGPPVANATGTRLEILCKTGAEK